MSDNILDLLNNEKEIENVYEFKQDDSQTNTTDDILEQEKEMITEKGNTEDTNDQFSVFIIMINKLPGYTKSFKYIVYAYHIQHFITSGIICLFVDFTSP